jgi:hypothetical protein
MPINTVISGGIIAPTLEVHYTPSLPLREYDATMTEAPARLPPNRPQYVLNSDKYSTSIKIDKWAITSTKKPISNGPEIEAYVHFQLILSSIYDARNCKK